MAMMWSLCYDTVLAALDRASKGKGPTLIEAVSYRLSDHTTADDASRYRSDDELNQAWQFEPIKRLKSLLNRHQGAWSDEQEETWLLACKEQVEIAVDHYMNLPPQAPESAFDYLYEHAPAELKPTARRY